MKYIFLLLLCSQSVFAQSNSLPVWFIGVMKLQNLDKQYALSGFAKPSFVTADFNGDSVPDVAALVTERTTKKRGILLIHGKSSNYFLFGAGRVLGKARSDGHDDLKWVKRWKVNKSKYVYETTFDNGDIVGSKKIYLLHPGISLWDLMDGAPNSGGTICWNGKMYIWIHEGE